MGSFNNSCSGVPVGRGEQADIKIDMNRDPRAIKASIDVHLSAAHAAIFRLSGNPHRNRCCHPGFGMRRTTLHTAPTRSRANIATMGPWPNCAKYPGLTISL